MTESPWTPDEFARLLSLPPGHPERVAAEAHPAFESWVRMQDRFQSGVRTSLGERELGAARARLSAALERELGPMRGSHAAVSSPGPQRVGDRPAARWNWGFGAAPARFALAFAALAVVVSTAWWTLGQRSSPDLVRGDGEGITLEVATVDAQHVELHWNPMAGADHYRVVFLSADMAEVARVDSVQTTTLALSHDSLPTGLAPGQRVMAEVAAMSLGDVVRRSGVRAVVMP